ncbi:MAG TPA: aminotransferase class V-fold PLP-dependent enzyme [Candidatus Ozemobacteraceae bacterium]
MFTQEERLRLFPVTDKWIYLNHAAIGPLPRYVREAAERYLEAVSTDGEKHWEHTGPVADELRGMLASALHMPREGIALTRNVSEGMSILASGLDWKAGDNVVLPSVEFPANVYPWMNLEHLGVDLRRVEPVDGRIGVESIVNAIDSRTRVVSISSVQFFSGFVANLPALSAECRRRGVLLCVDCIQHLGALPLDLAAAGVDFLAGGGHKWLMAGEGIGFVACRPELAERLRPALIGWQGVRQWEDFFDQRLDFKPGALRFETGTLSAFGIHALHASLRGLASYGFERVAELVRENSRLVRRGALHRGFELALPDAELASPAGTSGITSFRIEGVSAADLAARLKEAGVQVSARQGFLRVSPHFYNTPDEIEEFFTRLDTIIG